MKRVHSPWFVLALLAVPVLWCTGCPKKEGPGAEGEAKGERYYEREVGKNPVQAPVDYLYVTTVKAPRHIKETAFLATLNNEIKSFWGLEGRYPESLKELEQWRGAPLPRLPKGLGYDYDPNTGQLKAVEVPLEDEE